MKLTKNRQLILQLLAENDGEEYPPYSVSSLMYMLDDVITFQWQGYEQYGLNKVPSKQQMHRTIRDLWSEGYVVGSKSIEEPIENGLPSRVIRYQLASEVTQNFIASECLVIYKKVSKAMHGINIFGQPFGWGLCVDEVRLITSKVRAMLHKIHPDKQEGFIEQFNQMTQCMAWIREGVPLPTDDISLLKSQVTSKHLPQ